MTDKQLRAAVLQKFYDERKNVEWDQDPAQIIPDIKDEEFYRICVQLEEFGLLEGRFIKGTRGGSWAVVGASLKITAFGVLAVEDEGQSSNVPLDFSQVTQHIHISDSSGIQVGNHNTLSIVNAIQALEQRIDLCDATDEDKTEAKGLLARFMQHPVTAAVIGAAAGGVATAINK